MALKWSQLVGLISIINLVIKYISCFYNLAILKTNTKACAHNKLRICHGCAMVYTWKPIRPFSWIDVIIAFFCKLFVVIFPKVRHHCYFIVLFV